jgi:hypothetical protein
MDQDPQVWKVARKLVGQHGNEAPGIARERAREKFQGGDYPSGVAWERIERVAAELVRGEAGKDNG